MSTLNNSNDDVAECPLCMEPLEVDDLNFYPCTCGYQICRFCWHRIRTDENELCPACRKAYPENPADFKPLSQEQISALKAEKRQRDQQRKQKISENRKHLANVRVVQKNLVFVVGLPPRLADAEILKKHEYFGKYGKIHKVVINPSTTYAGVQGPSASAYVTYCLNNDALRAIQSVNNIMIDGRPIKTSLGTTKYCSHFMKNQQCPKPDCMYLHELGDLEASFTKEEMHNGKHQEYEKRLHDALIAQATVTNNNNNNNNNNSTNTTTPNNTASSPNGKLSENNKQTSENGTQNGPEKNKEAWPSLSTSPVNKETNGKSNKNGNNKENGGKKAKAEKTKNKKSSINSTSSNGSSDSTTANSTSSIGSAKSKDSGKDSGFNINKDANNGEAPKQTMSADEELNLLSEIENDASSNDLDGKADTPSLSLSSSGDSGTVSESVSGKSSPTNFSDTANENGHTTQLDVDKQQNKTNLEKNSQSLFNDNFSPSSNRNEINTNCHPLTGNVIDTTSRFSKLGLFDDNNSFFSSNTFQPSPFFKLDSQATQLRNADTNNQTNSPQLPDLLSGTESDKERHDLHDKLSLLKGLGDFNSQLGNLQNSFGSINGLDDLQKRRNMVNGLGLHSSGLIGDNAIDYFTGPNEPNRFSQLTQQSTQHPRTQQMQNGLHTSDGMNQSYPNNLSQFFDFHKNQQQKQYATQQQQHNQQQLFFPDQLNMSNLLDQSRLMDRRLNSQYLDQQNTQNSLLGSQMHKQRMMNSQLGMNTSQAQQQHMNNSSHLHTSNNSQNSRLQSFFHQQQQQQQQQQQHQQQQNPHSSSVDDELDFDPFFETQKGLAELIENELLQQQSQSNQSAKMMDNSTPRCRLPPPGFSHMNAFGLGVPRATTQTSKILPFMNNGSSQSSQSQQSNWQHHPVQQQQPQQNMNYGIHDQMSNLLSKQNQQSNKGGFGNMSDWSLMDPAIVSFRQYQQSFMSGPPQQSQNDNMFITPPHHAPQQANGQFDTNKSKSNEYTNRNYQSSYGAPHGLNIQNGIMNQQQANSQQVNFSHSNWLNADQSQSNLFMNHNLSNGFLNQYHDKSSIPLPPGFTPATLPKQKTECIN